jgi:hypothetical protein
MKPECPGLSVEAENQQQPCWIQDASGANETAGTDYYALPAVYFRITLSLDDVKATIS